VSDLEDVAGLADLPPGTQKAVMLGGTRVLLCHEAPPGQIWAVKDLCPHAFQPLAGGVVRGGTIQCPKHGACFDLATGRSTNTVTPRPAAVHAVKVHEGRILVSAQPLPLT
jgi:nitrite reductase/ring-hydroxylating ferredoxin subunit